MKIINDTKFAQFLQELEERESVQEPNDELDLLDYHWFLVSILEGLENPSRLEILKDSNGECINYNLLEANIDDSNINKLKLRLENRQDNVIEDHLFDIKKCDDARVPDINSRKYYVHTEDDMYRFVIFLLKN